MSPVLSLAVTLPVGVVVAGDTGETLNFTVIACPTTEVLGVCVVMAVVLLAFMAVVNWLAEAAR
jgi:hypothetical protein